MEESRVFEGKFGQVKTIIIDGKPWFAAADIGRALKVDRGCITRALKWLGTDEQMHCAMSPFKRTQILVLSKSGVINTVNHSAKPLAPEVKKWLECEVFPALDVKQPTDAECKQDAVGDDELRTFTNSEFGNVRTDVDENGKALFCAKDVATALGYKDTINAVKSHCKGVVKRHYLSQGGSQFTSFIPESDVYRLAFSSKLPSAERFTDWVTEEILPSIRKTGGYIAGQESMTDSELLAKAVLVAQRTIEERTLALQRANEAIGKLTPKAEFADAIANDDGLLTANQIAKSYGMSAIALNKKLYEAGIQYKQGKQWLLYARYADKGYVKMITIMDATNKARQQMKWTQRGREFIYKVLKKKGFVPNIVMDGM